MSKVTHLVLWIPLLFSAFYLIFWIKIVQNEKVAFDEFVLEKQINYAADAATEELLMSPKLSQDYAEEGYVCIEPDLGKDEFISIMEYSMGYIPSDFNESLFANKYLRALVICGWDGYYAYWKQEVDDGEYDLVRTPKVPYTYEKDGIQYSLNLGLESAFHDSNYTGTHQNAYGPSKCEPFENILDYEKDGKEPPTRDEQLQAINTQVGDALNYALYHSYSQGHMLKNYEIPDMASEVKGSQPVNKITVIGVVEGPATSAFTTVAAGCIGGARIVANDDVYAVKVNGYLGSPNLNDICVYATASDWKKLGVDPDTLRVGASPNVCFEGTGGVSKSLGTITNTQYYANCFDAAKEGYKDLMILYKAE